MLHRSLPIAPTHCLTFDVEEHFQVNAFDSPAQRARWGTSESRVEANTDKVLALLADHRVLATFFVLGWVAERHAGLVTRIARAGHEIASHGYGHELITGLTPDAFREDVRKAKKILEDVIGAPVEGYRAPTFTIVPRTAWALEVLVQEGYRWDSSIVPVRHDVYGWSGASPTPYRIHTASGALDELPPTTVRFLGTRLAVGGGGYFRLYPYPLVRRWLRSVEAAGESLMFYLHPWELDPDQPRMAGGRLSTFRHYQNLTRVEGRLRHLLEDFRFTSVREAMPTLQRRIARDAREAQRGAASR